MIQISKKIRQPATSDSQKLTQQLFYRKHIYLIIRFMSFESIQNKIYNILRYNVILFAIYFLIHYIIYTFESESLYIYCECYYVLILFLISRITFHTLTPRIRMLFPRMFLLRLGRYKSRLFLILIMWIEDFLI